MSKYYIRTNSDRCISCKACEVHCKVKNRVPVGAKLGQIVTVGPVDKGGKPKMMNLFMPCFHCEQPWCVAACPTGAMIRRDEDGIVYVDAELCVGCKACIIACPWDIPQWDEESGRAIKCDFCRDRIDAGKKPACVTACTAHALEFVSPNETSGKVRFKYGKKLLEHQSKVKFL
ncbi:4Fe-4S dicluster domain-containing protein [Desulfovibrio inopinatus]|uniref:4Fe-4S dicluster domain-containing protein n=1 Tax=Desulfovibrio inopinatus TaxID=102109 RepID=UPI00041DC02E|nr:4Fe-4S dicluster domain-containing protein [Desulfovibrio inopinatus]